MPPTAPQTIPFGATSQGKASRRSQQEFQRSGAEGKCIEARELIIPMYGRSWRLTARQRPW